MTTQKFQNLDQYKVQVSDRVKRLYDLEDIAIAAIGLDYEGIKKFHNIDPYSLIRVGEDLVNNYFNGEIADAYHHVMIEKKKITPNK